MDPYTHRIRDLTCKNNLEERLHSQAVRAFHEAGVVEVLVRLANRMDEVFPF